jgi:hypothetical protein
MPSTVARGVVSASWETTSRKPGIKAQADVAASRQTPAKGRVIVQALAGFATFIVCLSFLPGQYCKYWPIHIGETITFT